MTTEQETPWRYAITRRGSAWTWELWHLELDGYLHPSYGMGLYKTESSALRAVQRWLRKNGVVAKRWKSWEDE